jgi:hypothetical protein
MDDYCLMSSEQNFNYIQDDVLVDYKRLISIFSDIKQWATYVDNIILKSDRSNIAKLRICAHNLEIEKGRYFQINRTERFCKICNDLEIEDGNHFLWQ